MERQPAELIAHRFRTGAEIDQVIAQAVRQAVLEHKRAGNPVAAWQDGKVVIISPDDIVVSEDEETPPA